MPCRKLFSFCHCGGELLIVVKNSTGLVVCRDCGNSKPACDDSSHPLLTPQTKEPDQPQEPSPATLRKEPVYRKDSRSFGCGSINGNRNGDEPSCHRRHHDKLYCILKEGHQLVAGSVDTIYGPDGWKRYLERHPEPWCRPEESYHTNSLGQEVDHRGQPVKGEPPPIAQRITAEEMLNRIVLLNHGEPGWWKSPEKVAEMVATWGVRTKAHGVMADYEQEEVARLSGDVHASILIARTGSGLFTCGIAARWGDGIICLEPSVGSVPFDTEFAARRAAYRDLIASLEAGRGVAKHQQRQLLLAAVKEKDRDRGLFG